jgi:alanyl-tRNA synthetase
MNNAVEKIYQLGESKISEIKALQKEIDKLKKEKLASSSNLTTQKIGEINFVHHFFDGANAKEVRDLAAETKNKKDYQENSIILFFGSDNDKISAVLAISQNLTSQFHAGKIIPQIAEKIGGKGGGGKPDLAMCGGSNKNAIKEAVNIIKCQIEKAL